MEPDNKYRYVFRCEESLVAEGKVLAKAYRLSFNMLLTFLLEHAVEEWAVPGMEARKRPDEAIEDEKSLT